MEDDNIKKQVPLRVDFAGGWLDVPKFSIRGEYVVNCAISPLVSLDNWCYQKKAGLGGSGAWAILNGEDGVKSEIDLGVGWQDPAVIKETGCCVWNSGQEPSLYYKLKGGFLEGKMAIYWTGSSHNTPGLVDLWRNYAKIAIAGRMAREGVLEQEIRKLSTAVGLSYYAQIEEGMKELPDIKNALAYKYCGGGHGGYALYLFADAIERQEALLDHLNLIAVEPYCKG